MINKLLNNLEAKKERERFKRVTKRSSAHIILSLKKNVVDIVHDRTVYDSNRPEINELYNQIVNNLEKMIDDKLVSTKRLYRVNKSSKVNLNIYGILHTECNILDNELKKYIERFHIFFDDDIYLKITELEKNNFNLGKLNYSLLMIGGMADSYEIAKGSCQLKEELKDHILAINSFIEILNKKLEVKT